MDQINLLLVDAAQMAGDNNIYSRIVGRTLYKSLREEIFKISEPGVLIINFQDINQVQDSVLLISIMPLLGLCRKNKWRKTIICSNVSELHKRVFQNAIILWPDVSDPYGDKPNDRNRILLLTSGQSHFREYDLLGEMSEFEQELWVKIQNIDLKPIPLSYLAEQINSNQKIILDRLSIFLENQILLLLNEGGQITIHRLPDLIEMVGGQ